MSLRNEKELTLKYVDQIETTIREWVWTRRYDGRSELVGVGEAAKRIALLSGSYPDLVAEIERLRGVLEEANALVAKFREDAKGLAVSLKVAFDEGFYEGRANQHLEKAWQQSNTKSVADLFTRASPTEPARRG